MTRFLTWSLGLLLIALCAVCTLQWLREASLRQTVREVDERLKAEQQARVALEDKLQSWEKEIKLLTLRIDEQGSKIGELETTNGALQAQATAEKARADQLAAQLAAQLTSAQGSLSQGSESLAATNEAIKTQNTAIQKQNGMLQALTTERDSLVDKLNDRTRAYNELMEKYNRLVR